jgi:mannose-6-phosphate isomerase
MIFQLTPTIQRKIWGGQKLGPLKSVISQKGEDPIGETWEVSVHPDGPCYINGEKLQERIDMKLPYLVKLIDTSEVLSIQVHPDDLYAQTHEKSSGKSECWVILEALEGAGIYLGLKPHVTKEVFLKALKNEEKINELLHFYPVKKGDFYFVPAGSIHAIGAGITLAEVQQSSGITYRVWDWDRVDSTGKKRELHVQKSLDVISFEGQKNLLDFFNFKQNLFDKEGIHEIIEHADFKLSVGVLGQNQTRTYSLTKKQRYASVLALSGKLTINGENISPMSSVLIDRESQMTLESQSTETTFLLVE